MTPNIDRLEAAEKERDALRAKIERMEKQEPMDSNYIELLDSAQKIVESYVYFRRDVAGTPLENDIAIWMVDFVLAQPAPSVPDAWKLVPIEPTEAMVTAFAELFNVRDQKNTFGPAFRAALAAAPEAKP